MEKSTAKAIMKEIPDLPALDINKVIRLVCEVKFEGKDAKQALLEFAAPYKKSAVKYVRKKAESTVATQIDRLQNDKLSGKKFAKELVKCTEQVGTLVWQYMHGQIDEKTFVQKMQKTELKNVCSQILAAVGVEELLQKELMECLKIRQIGVPASGMVKLTQAEIAQLDLGILGSVGVDLNVEALGKLLLKGVDPAQLSQLNLQELSALFPWLVPLGLATISYAASVAAYKELRKALDQLDAAHERRLEIEAACTESINMIREYRTEMNEVVDQYLTQRLTAFDSGFREMDQAILDGDVDGYIRGSVEIQQALGYDVQFTTQEEFDDLMESDFAFKL